MSSFIILDDGRAWVAPDGAFDVVIEALAHSLATANHGHALATWLLTQRTSILGMGMGSIDVRELTTNNHALFFAALAQVLSNNHRAPGLAAWAGRIQLLGHMVAACQRGEPPMNLNPDMKEVVPRSGQRAGPGW